MPCQDGATLGADRLPGQRSCHRSTRSRHAWAVAATAFCCPTQPTIASDLLALTLRNRISSDGDFAQHDAAFASRSAFWGAYPRGQQVAPGRIRGLPLLLRGHFLLHVHRMEDATPQHTRIWAGAPLAVSHANPMPALLPTPSRPASLPNHPPIPCLPPILRLPPYTLHPIPRQPLALLPHLAAQEPDCHRRPQTAILAAAPAICARPTLGCQRNVCRIHLSV
mmetsp:Transcript_41989/g.94872  ORF Transcript_41989/g.94872 Transcript_41989/m.94872 type:complete len:223 (-) Transcript_41989:684-1352(-)